MHDVNWWLMALSFLLGLVLTFLFMIRRVTREVPIYAALGRGPKVDVKKPAVDVKAPAVDVKKPDVDVKKVAPVVAAAAAAPVVAKVIKDEPFGAGSVRFAKSVAPPRAEYLVKGDEDTMRYFTVESPDYEKVGAEVWFKDKIVLIGATAFAGRANAVLVELHLVEELGEADVERHVPCRADGPNLLEPCTIGALRTPFCEQLDEDLHLPGVTVVVQEPGVAHEFDHVGCNGNIPEFVLQRVYVKARGHELTNHGFGIAHLV